MCVYAGNDQDGLAFRGLLLLLPVVWLVVWASAAAVLWRRREQRCPVLLAGGAGRTARCRSTAADRGDGHLRHTRMRLRCKRSGGKDSHTSFFRQYVAQMQRKRIPSVMRTAI